MNVLIVDDHPVNRRLLRAQLEGENVTVLEAADGLEALALLAREKVDAIISDILMPRMDGYRLCREVRADARMCPVPFIFYTATYTSPGDEKFSRDLGADKFLKKPTPTPVIMEALRQVLSAPPRSQPVAQIEEQALTQEYTDRLVAKLEEKNSSLETAVSQLRLQAIALETAANAILIADAQGVIVWVNPAFTSLTGYAVEEAVGQNPRLLKSGLHGPGFYERLWKTILAGETWRGEFTNRRKDGSLYSDEHTITPVRDAEGHVTHFVTVMQDITARKQAESTLRENQERLRIVTEHARVGLVLVDPDRRYVYANAAYGRILGLRDPDLTGRPVSEVLRDVYEAQIRPRLDLAFTGERVAYELRRTSSDGDRHYAVTYEPIRERGTVSRVLVVIIDITERKRTEAALSLFRTLIDRSNDGFEVVDAATGRFLDVNEKSCEEHGYTRAEMLALQVTDVDMAVVPGGWPARVEAIKQAGSKTIEGLHRRKDGLTFPVEVNVKHVHLDRDYLIAVVRNITERKRADAALRESEKRFRELAESIHEVFWVTDAANQRILYVSPAYEKIWGRSCESLYQSPESWLEAVHPEDRARLREAMAAKQNAGTYDEDYRILRPDGTSRWIRDRAFPIYNATGEVERVVGAARDVTDEMITWEALRENRQLLEKAQQVARIGSWVSHPSRAGRLDWSVETCRIFGYAPGEFDGRLETFLSHVHAEDRQPVAEAMQTALAGGRAYDLEHRIVRRDGQTRWLHEQADIERDEAGQPVRVVGVAHDITERRLLEDQFRQSQKMEAIGQLAGGVAHDFNNILTAMIMHAELLIYDVPEQFQDGLKQIRGYAERAADLTRQLLLFSRRQVMQPRGLNLNEVVTSLAKMLNRMIAEDVRLELHLHAAPLLVQADAGMLDQVLMNLAVNARDAMPEGGQLLIKTSEQIVDEAVANLHPDAKPGRYACLSVSDTGTGIPPEVLPRIFEPFFTTKAEGKGTGLGLATVFGIVKQHHGWLKVYSEPGHGTNFQVYLPMGDEKTRLDDSPATSLKSSQGTETILLVEDDKAVRDLTRRMLERKGYHIIEASNGPEAISLWREHRDQIALVLTDLVMPGGVSGQQLARQLQTEHPLLKVIFTSGYSAELAGKQLLLAAGENFLQKPVPAARLLECVRHCLDG